MNLNGAIVFFLLIFACAFLLFLSGLIVFLYYKFLEPLFLKKRRGSEKGGCHEA